MCPIPSTIAFSNPPPSTPTRRPARSRWPPAPTGFGSARPPLRSSSSDLRLKLTRAQGPQHRHQSHSHPSPSEGPSQIEASGQRKGWHARLCLPAGPSQYYRRRGHPQRTCWLALSADRTQRQARIRCSGGNECYTRRIPMDSRFLLTTQRPIPPWAHVGSAGTFGHGATMSKTRLGAM